METKNIVCRQQQVLFQIRSVEKNKKILNEVDVFYQKLLESDEEPEKMIDQFVKKLKMEKYPDILNKIQKQYNKWKRGKK